MAGKKVPKTKATAKVKTQPSPGKRATKKKKKTPKTSKTSKKVTAKTSKTSKTSKKVTAKTATPKTATPKNATPKTAAERLVRDKGIPHKKKIIALLALMLAYGTYKVASPLVGKYFAARAGETVDPLLEAIRAKAEADALAQAAENSKAAANAAAKAEKIANMKRDALWAAGGIAKIVEKVGGVGLRLSFGLAKGTAKLALDNPITRTLVNLLVIYPIILYTLYKTGLGKIAMLKLAPYAWNITKWILGKALKNILPGVWNAIKAALAAGATGGVYAAVGAAGGIAKLIGELLKKILAGARGGSGGGGGAVMVRETLQMGSPAVASTAGSFVSALSSGQSQSPSAVSAYTTPTGSQVASPAGISATSSDQSQSPINWTRPVNNNWLNQYASGSNDSGNRRAPRRKSGHAEKEIANNIQQATKINQYHRWFNKSPPRRSRSQAARRRPGPRSAAHIGGFGRLPIRDSGNGGLQQGVPPQGGPDVPASSQVALAAVVLKIIGKAGTTGKKTALAVLGALSGVQKARLRSVMQYVGIQRTASVLASIIGQPLNIVLAVLTRFFFGKAKMA